MADLDSAGVVIVGGGPAGMMAGLLLARAGVDVLLLEKHADFFRDFRGDTVHPSTMEALHDLGMLARFLQRPHNRLDKAQIRLAEQTYAIGDLSHLKCAAPFIAMMPQWDFLDFLRDEAEAFPGFTLKMQAPVTDLIASNGRHVGVRLANGQVIAARQLILMADGRGSLLRQHDILPLRNLGAPMDVFWFRLPKDGNPGSTLRGSISTGRMIVLIDRVSYWQAAMLIPKGQADIYKARSIAWIRAQVASAFPDLSFSGQGGLASLEDLFLLNVTLDRLECWHRPGLLAIGDAAHAMSPIGGVGINLAIQDAIAMANLLAAPLAQRQQVDHLLAKVQARRMFPTRIIQWAQKQAQDRVIGRVLDGNPITRAPLAVRLLDRCPMLQRIPGRIIGLGIRREQVRSQIQ